MGDFSEIEKFLIGQGLSERDCRFVTMYEYQCRKEFYESKKIHDWEVARWEVFNRILLSPDIKKGLKPKKPQDILPLPTDKAIKTDPVIVTEDDIDTLKRIGLFN